MATLNLDSARGHCLEKWLGACCQLGLCCYSAMGGGGGGGGALFLVHCFGYLKVTVNYLLLADL